MMPTGQARPAVIYNDLAALLPDWEISLRARGRQPTTIDSYLICARNLYNFLASRGMPTVVTSITREHVEHFLADMFERVKPATVAKPTDRCSSCSGFSSMTARSPATRWSGCLPHRWCLSSRCRS
jgi:hypothetical protein